MTLIFKCLECGKEFPAPSGKKIVKFCTDNCYKLYRKRHGTQFVAEAEAIFVRDEPDRRTARNKATPLPLADQGDDEQTTAGENEIVQNADNEVISFEDLSLSQLRELISTLLDQNERLSLEVEQLHQQITLSEKTPSGLRQVVCNFIQELVSLDVPDETLPLIPSTPSLPLTLSGQLCAGKGCSKPIGKNQVFCSPECAKTVLKSPSIMMLESGVLVTTPPKKEVMADVA